MSETVNRIAELQLCGSDSRAQSYNEGLKAAIHILESCDQPQLNENQQIVLEWLKDKCNLYSFIAYPFEAIKMLSMLDPEENELRVKYAIEELTYLEQSKVLEVFSRWAQNQEEEK